MPMYNMITISEAAEKLGVSRQRMHVLCRTYQLKTVPAGPIKVLDERELRKIPSERPTGKKISKN